MLLKNIFYAMTLFFALTHNVYEIKDLSPLKE